MKNRNDYEVGASSDRPWGRWAVLATGDGYAIKEISVNPGHILSLQSHEHRAEHWVILSGQAEVTLDGAKLAKGPDDEVFIPVKAKHRIANIGETVLVFVEVQTGPILSEEDIERYDDRYGR